MNYVHYWKPYCDLNVEQQLTPYVFFNFNLGPNVHLGGLSLQKESLNSDGLQLHQYQQIGQSPLTSTHEHKKPTKYDVGNPVHSLGQAQGYGGIKPINGIPLMFMYIHALSY